ncbi:hypothetical protein F4553_006710 [Allocatelliglobosispora scoriae]|uniref:Uncharacterized protein n=1 Tax=Allocatelliglobosispora scoriae TaxID=643052 RepID=A0A841C0A0_9ACTN|nr:hypothetical protein [Allocatelliglobosispora scoriae]
MAGIAIEHTTSRNRADFERGDGDGRRTGKGLAAVAC